MSHFKPGISFGDFVVREKKSGPAHLATQSVAERIDWLPMALVIAFVVLLGRLVQLQIFQGSRLRVLADENRVKQIKIFAPRGRILDRDGQVLAQGNREYPQGAAAAHVVGYLGQVVADEVGLLKDSGRTYQADDWVGRSGLEQAYEQTLRGVDGGQLVEVDNVGVVVRQLGQRSATAGQDLHTSLDADLQQTAYAALESKRGAVVVSRPDTGEILALVSSPSFDPNQINAQYSVLSAQKSLPLLNRAIGGVYPPGSTFKPAVAVGAITDKLVPADFSYEDRGIITIDKFSYTNWYFTQHGRTEGVIGWSKALARSTDTFFYKVGEKMGADNLLKWAKAFGLGSKTDIDIPGEVSGLVPRRTQWYVGNIYHLAIGQDDLLATPAQVNVLTNIVATGGKRCPLKISNFKFQISNCEDMTLLPEAIGVVHKGMVAACTEGGTAWPFFSWNANPERPTIACKTGTAEYVLPTGKIGTHAWLTAFAPVNKPEVSVTVLVEGGGEGSRAAAPIARKIFAKYFEVEDNFNYSTISGIGE